MRTLYLDCPSGAAGDMLLGALIDAGAPLADVRHAVQSVGVDGWSLEFEETSRGGLRAGRAIVAAAAGPERVWRDIEAMLSAAGLDDAVRRRALAAFELLARAEARVHRIDPADVVFHEVGGIDAIVDIVGGSAALEHFMPARVLCSPVAAGSGTASTAHGALTVPVPAVLEIASLTDLPLSGEGDGELLTPTGAALLATWAEGFGTLPAMDVSSVGYGAGERERDVPNVVRVIVGSTWETAGGDEVVIEANVDDMSPELIPHAIDALLAAGASDAWASSILMKKGRPAFRISALCPQPARHRVLAALYRETTTLGARVTPVYKESLQRRWVETTVAGHPVRVKLGIAGGEVLNVAPEHDDALAASEASGLPLKEVYERARSAARREMEPEGEGGAS